jgi:nitrite reductase (cytochrome c-552)
MTDLLDAINAARARGATTTQFEQALDLRRKAQWPLDYVAAEDSTGFHAREEAAMVLGEAADYGRQGELATLRRDAGSAAGAKPTPNH